jgi:CheY-like chemotaxis protein
MPGRQGLVLIAHDCEPTVELLASVQAHNRYTAALTLPETLRQRAVRLLARMLREDGFSIAIAAGVRDARAQLMRSPPPEALILDVSRLSGAFLGVLLEARRKQPNIPVIVASSVPEASAVSERGSREDISLEDAGEGLGIVGPSPIFLTKPFEYGELRLELSRVLRCHTGQMLRVPDPYEIDRAIAKDKPG